MPKAAIVNSLSQSAILRIDSEAKRLIDELEDLFAIRRDPKSEIVHVIEESHPPVVQRGFMEPGYRQIHLVQKEIRVLVHGVAL
jgi:hypothetical protein